MNRAGEDKTRSRSLALRGVIKRCPLGLSVLVLWAVELKLPRMPGEDTLDHEGALEVVGLGAVGIETTDTSSADATALPATQQLACGQETGIPFLAL